MTRREMYVTFAFIQFTKSISSFRYHWSLLVRVPFVEYDIGRGVVVTGGGTA